MTLEEAIHHCNEVAINEKCTECAEDHRQLAGWLTELQEKRELLYTIDSMYTETEKYSLLLLEKLRAAKRLIDLIVKDVGAAHCESCAYSGDYNNNCLSCYNGGNWKWRYADDVVQFLSEEF